MPRSPALILAFLAFLPPAAVPVAGLLRAAAPQEAVPALDLKAAHRGTPAIDNALLALSHPSESTASFFRAARLAFEAHPFAAFADLPELRAEAEARGLLLTGGPMLGQRTEDGVSVWVRTAHPAEVSIVVQAPDGERRFGPVASTVASDLTAVVPVAGLDPWTTYPYRVLVDGRPVSLSQDAAIGALRDRGAPGRTRIAFGADFHKTGLWNQALLERIRSQDNQALLLLGDLAVDDRNDRVGLHRSDYLLRDLSPGWRGLVARTPVYATWDDHDYFDNDLAGIPKGFTAEARARVRKVWHQNWNNPGRDLSPADKGIQFRTRIGCCDVIMLDTRSQRGAAGESERFLGAEQMRWLERELAACTGPFVILTSGTMWSDNISEGKDSWGVRDPESRERLFAFIEKRRIGGVLLLSGDRHGARVIRIPRPSGFHFWEFELGSLGAHTGPAAFGKDKKTQPFGVAGVPLFGQFLFDTAGAEPRVTARVLDAKGDERYTVTLTRGELTPPAR